MTPFDSIFKSTLLLSTVAMLTVQTAKAQTIPLTTAGAAYTQDFDALVSVASTTNALAINGWTMTESGGGARDNELYAVDSGTSTTGDTYSYGQTGATERALGNLRSGTLISLVGAAFTNTIGATITSLDISYVGEQWRLGTAGRTDQLTFEYSTDATSLTTGTWTVVTVLNFITPATATVGAKDGNLAANRTLLSASIPSLSIADGATFWIRWSDIDASGADDGLAVDDFTLTPQTSPVITVPEMDIQWNAVSIADGSAFPVTFNGTYFADQSICAGALSHTYTILNTGSAVLSLTGVPTVSLSGTGAADFTVTTQPSATIAAGGSSTFVISYDPSVTGSSSAIVEIANDDFDENPYEFYILGSAEEATITASSQTNIACNGGNDGALSVTAAGTGTLSYDWEPGTPTGDGTSGISGLTAGVYSITVTDQGTCQAMATFTVTEPAAISLSTTATSTVICSGNTVTLSATATGGTGTLTYTWSTLDNGPDIAVTPTVTTTYTVIAFDANSCEVNNVISITVNALPNVSAVTNNTLLCTGETASLTASGADTYTWSTTETSTVIAVSPTVTTDYTVTGTDVNGCVNNFVFTQDVSTCTGIASIDQQVVVSIYPNPSNGEYTIDLPVNATVEIANQLGQVIYSKQLVQGKNQVSINDYAEGIYFLKTTVDGKVNITKIIKQ